MNINIAVIFSLLIGISNSQHNKSIRDYILMFENDAKRYNVILTRSKPRLSIVDHTLYIKDESGLDIEVDAYVKNSTKTIHFNSQSTMFQTNRKTLVYHELGHYLEKPVILTHLFRSKLTRAFRSKLTHPYRSMLTT